MNTNMLRSIMLLNGDNQNMLSEYLGISPQRLSSKINEKNGAEFTQNEIRSIKQKYNLSAKKVDEIFFTPIIS